jgi:plastocyanin
MRLASLLAFLALAAGGLAACGGDNGGGGNAGTQGAATGTQPATAAPAGGEVKVSMKDIKYVPANVTVRAGQKITWTNDDPVAHTVTARSGASFDSGTIPPGDTYSQTIDRPGKIDYVCVIHPNQTGTITVRG